MNIENHRTIEKAELINDHYFFNSAYLSELWAAQDLIEKRDSGLIAGGQVEEQIEDELRHARMLKNSMINFGFQPVEDLSFSMHEVIYHQICCIDLKAVYGSPVSFWGMHNIMEKRALWNYRTYLRGGRIDEYKSVLKKIIDDEKGHIKDLASNPIVDLIAQMDRWVYRIHLAQHYNKMDLIRCDSFWKDYFSGNLKKV